MTNPKYKRLMIQQEPLQVSGKVALTAKRKVVWKNVCLLGDEMRECLVEMSNTKLKFYVVALDLEIGKFHVIELWRAQATKLIKACDNSLEKLMTYLEFRYGVL